MQNVINEFINTTRRYGKTKKKNMNIFHMQYEILNINLQITMIKSVNIK